MGSRWYARIPGLRLVPSRKDRRRLRAKPALRTRLGFETLEDRSVPASPATAKIDDAGRLSIVGTPGNDTVWLARTPGVSGTGDRLSLTVEGRGEVWSGPESAIPARTIVVKLEDGNDFADLGAARMRVEFDGGAGNDTLTGSDGNDLFKVGSGVDRIFGGGGTDRLEATADSHMQLTASVLQVALPNAAISTTSFMGIEEAKLTGGPSANELDAREFSGSVTLAGGGGNDMLFGGAGTSVLLGEGARYDHLVAGTGPTQFFGGEHGGTIFAGRPVLSAAQLAGQPTFVPNDERYRKPSLPTEPVARRAALDRFWTDFLDEYRAQLPDPSAASEAPLRYLVERLLADDRVRDIRWIAYLVATAYHETGTYIPRDEERPANPTAKYLADHPYLDPTVDGGNYFGRGWVQITWKTNYDEIGRLLGRPDLATNPAAANQLEAAYDILTYGILSGFFNDVNWIRADKTAGNPRQWGGLEQFLNNGVGGGEAVYRDARRIVNFWEVESTKPEAEAREQAFGRAAVKIQRALERAAAAIRGTAPETDGFLNFLNDLDRETKSAVTAPAAAALRRTATVDLPLVRDNLDDLTDLADRAVAPLDGLASVDAAAVAAPGPGGQPLTVAALRQRLIDTLQGAGFTVEFLTSNGTDTDANGNLLLLRYSPLSIPARSVGAGLDSAGGTGFSYLDDRVNGTLSGSIAASIGAATTDLRIGVDRAGNLPRLYVAAGGLIAGGTLAFDGAVTGGLSIRSLADVSLAGRLRGSIEAGLRIDDVDGVADGRLDADRLADGVRLGIDGEIRLEGATPGSRATLSAKLPVVGTIDWTATFVGAIHSDIAKPPSEWIAFTSEIGDPVDPLGVLVQAAKGVFQVFGGSTLPLPAGLGNLLGQDSVQVGGLSVPFDLAEKLGLPSGLGTLLRGTQLVGDLTSLQKVRDALQSIHPNLEFLPGRTLAGPTATLDVVRSLVRGDRVDLVRFAVEEKREWKPQPFEIFQLTLPVPPVFTATLSANLEAHAGYRAFLGLGVDTTGFYLDPNTQLSVRAGVRFGLEGAVEVAGLFGVSASLGVGLAVEAGVKVNDPDPTDGKIYFDEIFNGISASNSFLQTFNFFAGADATGFARVKLTLPWPLPDIGLVDEEFRIARLWDTNDNKTVRDVNARGTYRVRPLPTDKELDLSAMVDPVTRVLTLQATDIDPASIRVSGADGTVNVTWFGRGRGTVSNISRVRFLGGAQADRFEADANFDRPIEADGRGGSDVMVGGAASDTLVGGDGNDELAGGAGHDRLDGTTDDDTLAGGAGDDTAIGGLGRDRLDGGSGRDLLDGGADQDALVGGSGADTLVGGAASDDLYGGEGDDRLDGGIDGDRLHGEAGADLLLGGTDDAIDLLDGGDGRDTLAGGGGRDLLQGGAGDDALDGGTGDDYLTGDDGADVLVGGSGNDTLRGGAGADQVVGGLGDDVLAGGPGADVLYGDDKSATDHDGSARDRFEIELGVGEEGIGDTIDGGPDRDYLVLHGPQLTEQPAGAPPGGTPGDPAAFIDVRDDIRVRYDPASREYFAGWREYPEQHGFPILLVGDHVETRFAMPESVDAVIVEGRGGDDLLQVVGAGAHPFQLNGGAGNDILQGGRGHDVLVGGEGSDTVRGGAGDDLIYGGGGFDQLNAGDLGDVLDGEAGNDALHGERGDDTITGGEGRDVANGDAGNDLLTAGPGLLGDILRGGPGDDSLVGGIGADVLIGGADRDTLEGGDSFDVLDGGAEDDLLKGGAGRDMLFGGPGADSLFADGRAPGATDAIAPEYFAQLVLWHREYIQTDPNRSPAQKAADLALLDTTLARRSGTAPPTLPPWSPDDEILLIGELNYTVLDRQRSLLRTAASSLALQLLARDYPQLWSGSVANEAALVQAQNELAAISLAQIDVGLPLQSVLTDNLNGDAGNDTLWGSQFNDLLNGGEDNDRLLWSRGQDFLFGGNGTDEFIVFGTEEADQLNFRFEQETDTIAAELKTVNRVVINGEPSTVMYKEDTAVLLKRGNPDIESFGVDLLGGGDTATFEGLARWVPVEGQLIVDGGVGKDTINADTYEGRTRLSGGENDDTITGGKLQDVLDGGPGNDNLAGGLSADTITGGFGNDTIDGGSGTDSLDGGEDNDNLIGGTENDTLAGGSGNDSLSGGDGNDTISGGLDIDTLTGGAGADAFSEILVSGNRILDFIPGSGDAITTDQSTRTVFADQSGVIWALRTNDGLVRDGATINSEVRDAAIATNGTVWMLQRVGDLWYNGPNWINHASHVWRFSLSGSSPVITYAYQGSPGSIQFFKYVAGPDASQDALWAVANDLVYRNNQHQTVQYCITMYHFGVFTDYDSGFLDNYGEWFLDIGQDGVPSTWFHNNSNRRVFSDLQFVEGQYPMNYESRWFYTSEPRIYHPSRLWEQDAGGGQEGVFQFTINDRIWEVLFNGTATVGSRRLREQAYVGPGNNHVWIRISVNLPQGL